ncbi:hypothetical protein BV25DRAFT_1914855 [Artomyces pyxidatus]|uniref:Uncharacterized protein n=1 Tax=Artomyces pyxidatus TaxID=48021 RepID=A0ACB8T703_9AGAM|nr:hypothetical protein BV25DRAFT_1914855 [Artomyces pyxidatus]
MQFIPVIPTHEPSEEFGYYADGMLGPFEHLKWPQPYDGCEPHALAAPANPDLIRAEWNAIPVEDTVFQRRLPVWEDDAAPWFSLDAEKDWVAQEGVVDCGLVSRAVAKRLRAAAREVIARIDAFQPARGRWWGEPERRIGYTSQQITALNRALYTLKRNPMTLVNALQWFREAQRLILDLRAWMNYMGVVQADINRATQQGGGGVPPRPMRGVFTGNITTLRQLHTAGVPVWWLRPLHSLTNRTKIRHVRQPVHWGLSFSTERTQVLGKTLVVAPKWLDGVTMDGCSYGLTRRLTRYSLTNRPLVRLPTAALPETGDVNEVPPVTPTNIAQPEGSSRKRSKRGKHRPPVARDLPQKPAWHPQSHPAWEGVAQRLAALEVLQPKPLLYGVPPANAFGSNTGHKVHNWLRIRQWCYSQAQQTDDEPSILLSATHWRIALEGRYHAITYPIDAGILPQSSPELIARLPPAPLSDVASQPSAALGKRPLSTSQAGDAPDDAPGSVRTPRQRARRVMERVDICVRFGVVGGFAPYRPEIMPEWRGVAVTRARADDDQSLWTEVLWDLCVSQFRLEIAWMEMEVMEVAYADNYDLVRARDVTRIWTHGGALLPEPDSDPGPTDWLLAEEWKVRREGVSRFRDYITAWTGMPELPHPPASPCSQEAFEAFEKEVYEGYCKYFCEKKGRLPTIPPRRPPTLPPCPGDM